MTVSSEQVKLIHRRDRIISDRLKACRMEDTGEGMKQLAALNVALNEVNKKLGI